MTTELYSVHKTSWSPFRTHTHAHRAAASGSGYSQFQAVWYSPPSACGHSGSQRPEEAVITGGAVPAATLDPPGRTAGAEATGAVIRPTSSSVQRGAQVALALLWLRRVHVGIMSALGCKYTKLITITQTRGSNYLIKCTGSTQAPLLYRLNSGSVGRSLSKVSSRSKPFLLKGITCQNNLSKIYLKNISASHF